MNIFRNEKFSFVWLVVRVWLGWQWLEAGLHKVGEAAWTGPQAGAAVSGFLKGALANAAGDHPSVRPTYAAFVENVALPNAKLLSYMVAWGEVLVGIALIAGIFTTFAALMGALMNLNFMMAGSASTNPYMYTLAILVVIAGANAGRIGVDHYVMPAIRKALNRKTATEAS